MKIEKTEPFPYPAREDFTMQGACVQGARIGKKGSALLIISPRRYKLYTDGRDLVRIEEGHGFFKWKRGETPFSAGDCFEVCQTGEYEISGKGVYIVLRGQP